jgi:hypothetical protein
MSICFVIPVKIDSKKHEFYIHRCIASIRRLCNDPIILALAKGTQRIRADYPRIEQVENPYFSTMGCLYLFDKYRYADYAYILHDSMVVLSPLPAPSSNVSFIYDFHEPGMETQHYQSNYRKLLPADLCRDMIETQTQGCFGAAMGLYHHAVSKTGILKLVMLVTTKNDFCAMERVFAYICRKSQVGHNVLCGSIFGDANPWNHPEFETMSLPDLLSLGRKEYILKSLVGRTE